MKVVVKQEGGITFCGALTLLFVLFKLLNVIDWSWYWVFAPIWLPFVVVVGITVIGFLVYGVLSIFSALMAERRRKKRMAR